MTKVKWLSPNPKCDYCHFTNMPVFYDARTLAGPWAIMCEDDFQRFGVKLGVGYGQKYDGKTLEKLEG